MNDPICVAKNGNLYLLAEKSDMDSGNKQGPGQIYNSISRESYNIPNIQIAFKFGVWEDSTQEEFTQATGLTENKGGYGSGFAGHAGRPGKVGGSSPSGGGVKGKVRTKPNTKSGWKQVSNLAWTKTSGNNTTSVRQFGGEWKIQTFRSGTEYIRREAVKPPTTEDAAFAEAQHFLDSTDALEYIPFTEKSAMLRGDLYSDPKNLVPDVKKLIADYRTKAKSARSMESW